MDHKILEIRCVKDREKKFIMIKNKKNVYSTEIQMIENDIFLYKNV